MWIEVDDTVEFSLQGRTRSQLQLQDTYGTKKSQRHGVAIMNLRCDSAGRVLDTSPTLFRLNINLYYFSRIESHLEKHHKHFELRSIRGAPKDHLFTLLESNEEGNDAHWDASFDPRL